MYMYVSDIMKDNMDRGFHNMYIITYNSPTWGNSRAT